MAKRLFVAGMLLVLFVSLFAEVRTAADDDPLPNFNAPVDTTPLNADKVNRAFDVTLFQSPSLWDEDELSVAKRLEWPEESRTSTQSSYRLYPTEKNPVKILGARAYSCVLYATNGKPTEVSIVFVNEGDYNWSQNFAKTAHDWEKPPDNPTTSPEAPALSPDGTNSASEPAASASTNSTAADDPTDFDPSKLSSGDLSRIDDNVHEAFEKALRQDTQTLTNALTGLFGQPAHQGFGGGSETRERVLRWDWQGCSFLLSAPKDRYVALRIVPTALADNYGEGSAIERDDLKALLLQRVKRSDSGDVVVTEIPMVDQGPKGYCVPATWERYLRYLGIPADMYVLAMAAGSSGQQGTNLNVMVDNVDSLVTLYHRRIDNIPGDLDMKTIARNIDLGLPLMWTCTIHIPLERAISRRKAERRNVTDWDAWAAQLQANDKLEIAQQVTGTPSEGGHQRMIIGYNEKTDEIAISDSWSKAFAIRWMTLDEANAINLGESYVIEP